MKVTEVHFKRNYNISPLTMEHMHLSATVVVEENDTPEDALLLAQKTVEDFYKKAMGPVAEISRASEYDHLFQPEELPAIDYKEQDKKELVEYNKHKLIAIAGTIQLCENKTQAEQVVERNKEFLIDMYGGTELYLNLINAKFN